METDALLQAINEKLRQVIDPETGTDVIHMCLVQNIRIDKKGVVSYTFRPSSPLCPLAIPLSLMIHHAVGEVPGVAEQKIAVVDFTQAEKLNGVLNISSQDRI